MFRYLPLVLFFLLACSGDYYLSYFERVASIELPPGLTNVHHFTESDIAFTSHYTFPANSVLMFASDLDFQMEAPEEWMSILFIEELPEPWSNIPEDGIMLYYTGSDNWNKWDILMHPESGSLWVTMYYTDAAGDPPF